MNCEVVSVWPAIILLVMSAMGLGIAAVKHGQPRENHSFWTTLISEIITLSLLYWGGFFSALFGR